MTKINASDTPAEDLIDLGAASVETKGASKFPAPDAGQVQLRDQIGLSAD